MPAPRLINGTCTIIGGAAGVWAPALSSDRPHSTGRVATARRMRGSMMNLRKLRLANRDLWHGTCRIRKKVFHDQSGQTSLATEIILTSLGTCQHNNHSCPPDRCCRMEGQPIRSIRGIQKKEVAAAWSVAVALVCFTHSALQWPLGRNVSGTSIGGQQWGRRTLRWQTMCGQPTNPQHFSARSSLPEIFRVSGICPNRRQTQKRPPNS